MIRRYGEPCDKCEEPQCCWNYGYRESTGERINQIHQL